MEQFDVFSVRDLHKRSSDLLREAEAGHLSIITKHGKPAILAVPFDERLLNYGVHRAMALHLFEKHQPTLVQAAKLAGLALEEFLELLKNTNITVVDYPAEQLEDELKFTS